MKAKGLLPVGPSGEKVNLAVQRQTVNVKQAENLGEQAVAAANHANDGMVFAKHGTFGPKVNRGIDSLWKD